MGNQPPPPAQLSEEEERSVVDYDVSVLRIAALIKEMAERQHPGVMVMAGAGISVSAGIPDFRSPGTGLYDNLQKYDLPQPEAIFSLDYFREEPKAFCTLAKEMYPGNFKPTPTHFFIKLLEEKGVLRRCYTQNIDTLEREANIDPEKLVEAHGSFGDAACIDCHKAYSSEFVKEKVFADEIPRCTDPDCQGLVKPNIVFFGEPLPDRFVNLRTDDLEQAEVLLVLGTSLTVAPFCLLVNDVSPTAARLLINMERVGERDHTGHGLRLDAHDNYRDAALLGPCDDSVRALCDVLGWRSELEALISASHGTEPEAAGESPSPFSESALTYNWRKPPPVLPPMQPVLLTTPEAEANATLASGFKKWASATNKSTEGEGDATAEGGEGGGAGEAGEETALDCTPSNWSLTLIEPLTTGDMQGGTPAYFKVGNMPPSLVAGATPTEGMAEDEAALCRSREYHYLALMQNGAKMPSERTDRDHPFKDEDSLGPDRLRLRLPRVKGGLTLPYDFEVWYVNGQADEVLARWGPLTLESNAPEANEEEEEDNGPPMSDEEIIQLAEAISAQTGAPPEMFLGMLKQQQAAKAARWEAAQGADADAAGGSPAAVTEMEAGEPDVDVELDEDDAAPQTAPAVVRSGSVIEEDGAGGFDLG